MANDLCLNGIASASEFSGLSVTQFAPHTPVPAAFLNGIQSALYTLDNNKHNRNTNEDHYGYFRVHNTPTDSNDVVRLGDMGSIVAGGAICRFGGVKSSPSSVSADFSKYFSISGNVLTCKVQSCMILAMATADYQTGGLTDGNGGSHLTLTLNVGSIPIAVSNCNETVRSANGTMTMSATIFAACEVSQNQTVQLVVDNSSSLNHSSYSIVVLP